MVELFAELPEEIKRKNELIIDYALQKFDPEQCLSFISNYINSCEDEEEKQFVIFYFSLKMEQLLNENNND